MNQRIQELVRQAGLDDADFPIENWDNVPLAKFAELIVRECARIGELKEQGYSEYDPTVSVGWYMKQYFGVKE